MKTKIARNAALALVGLGALTIYILACTSFSPDDTKVLYPAFDLPGGATGIAVYDRESRRSEMLFVPTAYEQTNKAAPVLLRPQWLGNGSRILISWSGVKGNEDEGLNLLVLPFAGKGTVKLYRLPEFKDALERLVMPVPIVGERALLSDSADSVISLDLRTGTLQRHIIPGERSSLALYPAAGNKGAYYLEEKTEPNRALVFGRLDPNTLSLAPSIEFTNAPMDGSFFTYDEPGKRVAFVEGASDAMRLIVIETGRNTVTRPFTTKGEKLKFGNAVFSRKGDVLLASFQREMENQSSFGLMEIPLNGQPIRETVLIPATRVKEDMAVLYFQIAFSHDGKTAAVASTYLACSSPEFEPANCALFFVDLSDPNRKVTRILIPMPVERSAPPVK